MSKTAEAMKSKVVSDFNHIATACKTAFANGKPYVLATRACMQSLCAQLKDDEHFIDAFGVKIIEDGFLDHVSEKFGKTVENMLHSKQS